MVLRSPWHFHRHADGFDEMVDSVYIRRTLVIMIEESLNCPSRPIRPIVFDCLQQTLQVFADGGSVDCGTFEVSDFSLVEVIGVTA